MSVSNIVIIGTGLAGYSVAREIRARDKQAAILLITRDDGAFYSKPMLSTALARQQKPDDLINGTAAQMAQRLDARIETGTRVTSLDRERKLITTDHGDFRYDQLIFASGALPLRFPIPGNVEDSRVRSVNNLQDYRDFRTELGDSSKAVAIIGPGLIGCEFANDLTAVGHRPILIGPDPYPISTLLPQAVGEALQTAMTAAGIEWHLQTTVARLVHDGNRLRLTTADEQDVLADQVLSAIGLRPDTGIARDAGLDVGRGLKVDEYLRSSDPSIYAIGDVMELEGKVLPFVMPITHGARTLAATLCGTPTPLRYPPMPVVIKTPLYPLVLLPGEGELRISVTGDGIKAEQRNAAGALTGFVLGGDAVSEKQQLLKDVVS